MPPVIINISGDISLMDANDAASYVQEMAGDNANIIFGAMYDDTYADEASITVIATGLEDVNAKQERPRRSTSTQEYSFIRKEKPAGSSTFQSVPSRGQRFRTDHTACGAAAQHDADTVKQSPGEGYPDSGFLKKKLTKNQKGNRWSTCFEFPTKRKE